MALGAIFRNTITSIEKVFIIFLELANLAGLPGQQDPGVLLPLPLQFWDYEHASPGGLGFYMASGD